MSAMDQALDRIYDEIRALRSDFSHFQDRMVQIGFALVGVLVAALATVVVALA